MKVIALAVFASVALISGLAIYPLVNKRLVKERLSKLASQEEERPTLIATPEKWGVSWRSGAQAGIKPQELFKYREMLLSGGFKQGSLYAFLGSKLLLAAALPALFMMLVVVARGNLTGMKLLVLAVMFAVAGFLLPTIWLRRRIQNRKREIFHSLPDVLDLHDRLRRSRPGLDAAFIKTADNFTQRKGIRSLRRSTR